VYVIPGRKFVLWDGVMAYQRAWVPLSIGYQSCLCLCISPFFARFDGYGGAGYLGRIMCTWLMVVMDG